MTPEEAATIARIVATADGGCSDCVLDLFVALQWAFPDHDWLSLRPAGVGFSEQDFKDGIAQINQ